MKIAMFDSKLYDIESFDKYIKNIDDVEIKYYDSKLTIDTVKLAKGFDAVCVFVNDTINKEVIDKLVEYKIEILLLRCAGFNNVDIMYAYKKIHVLRVPSYSPHAVAEHAMALLLTSIRRIHKAYIRSRDYNFSLNGLTGFDLYSKTVGIIGTGRIGKCFVDICKGFSMNVLCYDKNPDYSIEEEGRVVYTDLNTLLKESDVISLHCPLNEDTYHMIDKEALLMCKKGVVIINTSRGALVDAKALLEGIKSRHIGAACLDVYEEEASFFFEDKSGHIMDDETLARLISMPNVIVTSHQAFLTIEALENIAKTTIDNALEFEKTNHCENEVCYALGNKDCKDKNCF